MNESQQCFGVGHILHPWSTCSQTPAPTHELSTRSGQVPIGPSGRKQPVCPMRETGLWRSTGRMWDPTTDAHVCPARIISTAAL